MRERAGLQWTVNVLPQVPLRWPVVGTVPPVVVGPGTLWVPPAWCAAVCPPLDPSLGVGQTSVCLVSPTASGSHVWEAALFLWGQSFRWHPLWLHFLWVLV